MWVLLTNTYLRTLIATTLIVTLIMINILFYKFTGNNILLGILILFIFWFLVLLGLSFVPWSKVGKWTMKILSTLFA